MKMYKTIFFTALIPWFFSCSSDATFDVVTPDGPHDSLVVKVYVNPTLTPDTAVVSEYITVSDTIVKYDPEYELYLGQGESILEIHLFWQHGIPTHHQGVLAAYYHWGKHGFKFPQACGKMEFQFSPAC